MTGGKRTFESADQFWEVWRIGGSVLTRSGAKGTEGQTSRHAMRSVGDARRFISDAVAERVLQGFCEQASTREEPPAATPRRFTCETDGAKKFWEISVAGAVQTVRFGVLGTAGTSHRKTWESPAAALRATERLVMQKRAHGYLGEGAPAPAPPAPAPDARHAELEEAMFAAPRDPAPALVYADWLLARGNPWGELINLQHALEAHPRDRRLRAREKNLLGALGLSGRWLELSWVRGRVDVAMVRSGPRRGPSLDLTTVAAPLFALPMCGGLRRLELSSDTEVVLAAARGQPCERRLEQLLVQDGLVPSGVGRLPRLRMLGVAGILDSKAAVSALCACPMLSRVDLGFASEASEVLAALEPLLVGRQLPNLVEFSVQQDDELSAELARVLPDSPLAGQLRGLAISHLDLLGARRLVAGARQLSALEWLDVSDRHSLVENDFRKLRAAFPRARLLTSRAP